MQAYFTKLKLQDFDLDHFLPNSAWGCIQKPILTPFKLELQSKGLKTTEHLSSAYLCFSFVCEGKSRLEYCFDNAERSPSPFPRPPFAVSHVGRAAVVIFQHFGRD